MCVRLRAEADAPPARIGGMRGPDRDQHPVKRVRRRAPARPMHHGVTLTTLIDQTTLPQPQAQTDLESDATPADLASLEAETAADLDPKALAELVAEPAAATRPTPRPAV